MATPSPRQAFCLAVGDVDDLKRYVERSNETDAESFGHLAGNRIMAKIGQLARDVAAECLADVHLWCAATFGGDEIIILADISAGRFREVLLELRRRFAQELPTSVSFAYGRYAHPGPLAPERGHAEALAILASIDRALFSVKRMARERGDGPRGELLEVMSDS
jgi:GGDEF domain-containing protein